MGAEGPVPFVVIALGAVLGANARYAVGLYAAERLGATFPYGTLLVNTTGSLAIGFLLTLIAGRLSLDPLWRLFFATGFLGSYTTFSAYTFETAMLVRQGAYLPALLYVVGSVVIGMLAVFVGIMVAEQL